MLTNCINCGAPLHGSVCEYCGTNYGGTEKKGGGVIIEFASPYDAYGKMKFGDKTIDVYIGKEKIETICAEDSGRTIDGRLMRTSVVRKRIFEIIER